MDTYHNILPLTVTKYLQKYSSGIWKAEFAGNRLFNNIAVIPAIKEYNNIIKLLESLAKCEPLYFEETLFLFVINNTASASDEIKGDNKKTIDYLKEIISPLGKPDSLTEGIYKCGLNIGFVDASTDELALPEKDGGVGLARKTGMDIALSLFNYNSSRRKTLICLDADCTVEPNYLTKIVETFNTVNHKAAYVGFEHPLPGDEENRLAIICYEIFLRYYVLGLMYAKSGYAIHTIGSTMICDYESYIKVEGMNKKKAAEDFYFMEKLCKNYKVSKIEGTKIYPSSRGSWRVPFGTGQRINRYLSKVQNEHLLYSPTSFDVLKEWLEIFNRPERLSAGEYLSKAKGIHPSLYNFLADNKFDESWKKIEENCKSDEQLTKQKHFWFDGFRTLKLIHYLRDNGFPQIEMYEAVETLLNKFGKGTGLTISPDYRTNINEQLVYLERLRELA
jgi:glycosyltransferase involved in cell wall biosynthesis